MTNSQRWRVYRETAFIAHSESGDILIRIGRINRKLDKLLSTNRADRWAFITASNPDSRVLSAKENARRNRELKAGIARLGLRAVRGRGQSRDEKWTEASLLVLDVPYRTAVELGRQYGQTAIVVGRRLKRARLVRCRTTAEQRLERLMTDMAEHLGG